MLSPELKSLLVTSDDGYGAIRNIAENSMLRAECEAQLPVLHAAVKQKAGKVGVQQVIGRRFALYPQPDRSDAEWAAWWSDYYDALADLSWAALEAGMANYVRNPTSEFMPKPGKLLEVCRTTPNDASKAYYRATKALERQPAPWIDAPVDVEPPKVKTVDDAVAIKRMADDLMKKFAVKSLGEPSQRSNLPSTAGKPDEGGLTKAMRELIAKREAGA